MFELKFNNIVWNTSVSPSLKPKKKTDSGRPRSGRTVYKEQVILDLQPLVLEEYVYKPIQHCVVYGGP